MRRIYLTIGILATAFTVYLSGCLVSPSASLGSAGNPGQRQLGMVTLETLEQSFSCDMNEQSRSVPMLFEPGRHVWIMTHAGPGGKTPVEPVAEGRDQADEPYSMIAGTIQTDADDRITLKDTVLVREHWAQTAEPMVSNWPFVGRLFKSTGATVTCTCMEIPGNVMIQRSSVIFAKEMTANEFDSFRQNPGTEMLLAELHFFFSQNGKQNDNRSAEAPSSSAEDGNRLPGN